MRHWSESTHLWASMSESGLRSMFYIRRVAPVNWLKLFSVAVFLLELLRARLSNVRNQRVFIKIAATGQF